MPSSQKISLRSLHGAFKCYRYLQGTNAILHVLRRSMWKLETCTITGEHSAACVQLLRNRCTRVEMLRTISKLNSKTWPQTTEDITLISVIFIRLVHLEMADGPLGVKVQPLKKKKSIQTEWVCYWNANFSKVFSGTVLLLKPTFVFKKQELQDVKQKWSRNKSATKFTF